MATIQDMSEAQLAFQVAGGDVDQFLVVRFRGSEGLCQLYRFELDLVSTEASIDFGTIVGKPAVLSVNAAGGTRWFHGIVSRFELTGNTHEQDYYRAELVPAVWLLTQRYNSRIFQHKSVPQIITDVLSQAGIAGDRVKQNLTGSHDPREYCVQYRETDYNFICRLMEEEGIWWYFQQTEEGHIFMMADSTAAYSPIEGDPQLPFVPPSGMNVQRDEPGEHIFRFRLGQEVRPNQVVLNDFNFENPPLKLQAKVSRDGTDREFYDYPGEYTDGGKGNALARLRSEEFETGRILAVGQSNCHRLAPALTFEMIEHPSSPLNAQYLVTRIRHEGKESTTRTAGGGSGRPSVLDATAHQSLIRARQDANETVRGLADALLQIANRLGTGDRTAHRSLTQWLYHAGQVAREMSNTAAASGGSPMEALALPNLIDDVARLGLVDYDAPVYECAFECIPQTVTFRPPRVTPWPVMRGSQTARVVGPSSEEIYCDKYGRVKVQFHWDREGKFDENSSCWIRVSQGMAGGQYGMMFLPRVGQEVIVEFLEGDPDQPIITGRVVNADHMPAYTLPDEKTKSYIKTRSSKGGGGTNEIRIEDLKDKEQILIYAQKDFHIRVKHDRVENVENDRHLDVKNNRVTKIGVDDNLDVIKNLNVRVGADNSLEVKGKESVKIAGTRSHQVAQDVVDKFDMNHKLDVGQTHACKAMSIKLEAASGIELKCGGSSIVLTPAAIFIVGGPMVNINSGNGPAVAPVSAGATSPTAPKAPLAADTVTPGKDTTYSGGETPPSATQPADVKGIEFPPKPAPEPQTSYLDIQLHDEEDKPVPGEKYRVTDSQGDVHEGTLDSNGKAHVVVPPGPCTVTFPNLDKTTWERR